MDQKLTMLAIPQPLAQALLDYIMQAPTGTATVRHANELLNELSKLKPVPEVPEKAADDGA